MKGKLNAYYEQACLSCQKFVKDPSMTVEKYIAETGNKVGKTLEVVDFARWQIGE